MRRPPLILWSYLLGELWRLILLTSCILVTVLAFAAAVRFLADGRLGPVETIRLMFLAMPPMLQYALPFAAGFGATLAYHRATVDNEMTAGYAAGISHRALLAPALVSGIVLAGVVLALSNFVIPRFLRSMEELITRDAARFIVSSIERKEAVRMENTLVYADLVRRYPGAGPGQPEKLYLQGVFAVEMGRDGAIRSQVSAREADVWLIRAADQAPEAAAAGESVTHVIIRSRGTLGQEAGRGSLDSETMNIARTIPNAFKDDPKFLSWSELVRLRNEPERINVINSHRRVLAARLAERATTGAIDVSLRERGWARFVAGEEAAITIHASGIEWRHEPQHWVFHPGAAPDGNPAPLLVERRFETGRVVLQQAESVVFRTAVDPESPEREVTVSLTMGGLSAQGAPPGTVASQLKSQTVGELAVPGVDVASLMGSDSAALMKTADAAMRANPNDDYVGSARAELGRRVADLMREITSKQHERFASAAACLVMILTGAIVGVRLRARLPLEVYLWAFFPALATVIAISAGQQMIHAKGLLGVPVMWAGVVALGVYTLIQYRHVARH